MTTTVGEAEDGPAELEPDGGETQVPAPLVWTRRERLVAGAALVGVLGQTVRYYAHLPALGYLVSRPLRYLLFYPSTLALVAAGAYARTGRDPSLVVVVVATLSYAIFDPLRWMAGARYGDRVARWFASQAGAPEAGSKGDLIGRVERFTAKWGVWALVLGWFTPIPMLLIHVAAGTAGMRFRKFILADLAGTLLWVLVIAGLGYAIGQPAVNTVKSISHYSLWVSIGAVVLGIATGMLRVRKIVPKA